MDDGTALWVENKGKDLKRNLRLCRTPGPDGGMNDTNKLDFVPNLWCNHQTMQNRFSHMISGNNIRGFNYRKL